MTERNLRLPVKRDPAPLPVLWRQAAPVVARGAALVVAGVVGQWLLRSATRKAVSLPFQSRRKGKALVRSEPSGEIIAISETVIRQRVVIRR